MQPDFKDCLEYGLKLLARKDRTTFELALCMRRKGYTDRKITAAVNKIRDMGIIDNARILYQIIEKQLLKRPCGRARLIQFLLSKGVPEIEADQAVNRFSDEVIIDSTVAYLKKKELSGKKLSAFLQRGGYSYEVFNTVMENLNAG